MTYLDALKRLLSISPCGLPCAVQHLGLSRERTLETLQHLQEGGWLIRTDADLWQVPLWVRQWLKSRRNVVRLGTIHGHDVRACRIKRFSGWVWLPVVDGAEVEDWKVGPEEVKAWAQRELKRTQ